MFAVLEKLKEGILDILLPKFCVGCGREGLYICKDCEVFLSEIENTTPGLISIWEYEGLMEKLIRKIKFDGCHHIIDELTKKAFKKINLNLPENTVITYVPMYRKKEKQRGFNQSEVIAKKVEEIIGKPTARFLEKVKDNRSQVGLGPKEREENVKGVFSLLHPSSKIAKNILLVDDVYTTGATAKECIRTLKRGGAKNVLMFTLAKRLNL